MSISKFPRVFIGLSVVIILLAVLTVGGFLKVNEINAQVQISGGFGQAYWDANFSAPGWGSFGSGGEEGGAGVFSEEQMKLIIEALIDPLFQEGKVNFMEALVKSAAGLVVYDKMVNNTNPSYAAYYQKFINYVNTNEGRKVALENIGNLTKDTSTKNVSTSETQKTGSGIFTDSETVDSIGGEVAEKHNGYYDAKAGNIKKLDANGKPTNLVDTLATEEFRGRTIGGGVWVSSDPNKAACDSLMIGDQTSSGGVDWLSDSKSGGGGGSPATNTNTNTNANTACTSYTYSEWGACADNNQTRSVKTKSPSGCVDSSSAVLTQSCVSPVSPIVTNTTNASQATSRPLLSVSTNRAASCQFNANGGFSYPAGTTFDTTGGYNHNAQLPETANGAKVYYVVCKDNTTGGVSDALKIEFTVNVDSAPVVTVMTPATQTGSNPVLKVITDRLAACQYKEDAVFAFGAGTPITTADGYDHSVSITALADGAHSFYVICKDNATNALSQPKQITTTLQRTASANAPVLANTTAVSQTINNSVLSVTTNIAAACQYKKDVVFTYGQGTALSGDSAKTTHQAQLSGLSAGTHTYYVICKNDSADAYSAAMAIMFAAGGGGAEVCADLSSNDRKNDAGRSYWGSGQANSTYLWQSVETGTRDKFDKVDWHAGYKFTPEKNGRINQLCGNFADGVTNRVSLYDGAYKELAAAEIEGNDLWRCVDIAPVEIKTDKKYYVIARIEDNPVYFEYKSAMLPKKSNNAIIEVGVRQTAGDVFDNEIRGYDHMIFGLVDVRVSWLPASITGPTVASSGPKGTVSSADASLSLQTSGARECRFDREDVSYGQMSYLMSGSGTDNFAQKVCGLENGRYTFYVRCKGTGGAENNVSSVINFTVDQ